MIEIGFELEFGSPYQARHLLKEVRSVLPEASRRKRDRFKTKWDGSLYFDNHIGVELVTPVYPLSKGVNVLRFLCGYLQCIGAETNGTCGLHVNIGFSSQTKTSKIDPLSLVILANDHYWARTFRRSTNEYCVPLCKRIKKVKSVDCLYEHLNNDREHYDAVSLTKLDEGRGKGYVEFRMIGNTNYHRKFPDIERAINCFVSALKNSTTKEYAPVVNEKVSKFLD